MSVENDSLEGFRGKVRLFPLPKLVLFPHVGQSLHIFEPRYRQMMTDALADDRLLALALLQPGWEEEYHKSPPIHPMVCVGRIMQEEKLADGRYNLLLHGLCRARIREEVTSAKLYRIARVELCPGQPVSDARRDRTLRKALRKAVTPYFSAHPPAVAQLRRLLDGPLPLGDLCDILGFALPLEAEEKQGLLEEVDVETRINMLLRHLRGHNPSPEDEQPRRRFPPEFSAN